MPKIKRKTRGTETNRRRRESQKKRPKRLPLTKKLLILEPNGLLGEMRDKPGTRFTKPSISVFERPFLAEFLEFCFENFSVGVWTSQKGWNMEEAVDRLFKNHKDNLLFCWDQEHCDRIPMDNTDESFFLKELRKIWGKKVKGVPWEKGDYDLSNTLLIDGSPANSSCNPENNAIFPLSYSYKDEVNDSSLGSGGDIRVYLEQLAPANNVQEFVKNNPFNQKGSLGSKGIEGEP